MRILVLEHAPDVPPGLLTGWARSRGHELEVVAVPRLDRWPSLDGADAVISLGSECSVQRSAQPWITAEVQFLAAAHARSLPILGICFGAQALAAALGGSVGRAADTEVTWREIESRDPGLIPAGPWLFWHEDMFTLPPGARLLGGHESEVDAFAAGASVGVQFHPEADAAVARGWIEAERKKLGADGIDRTGLDRQIERFAPAAAEHADDLFDRIAGLWSRDTSAGRAGVH